MHCLRPLRSRELPWVAIDELGQQRSPLSDSGHPAIGYLVVKGYFLPLSGCS